MDFWPFLFLASLEGLVQAAILSLTALGLSLVFGVMRIVNVAHGEFYMLGGVIAWSIISFIDINPALNFAIAIVIAPIIVAIIAYICNILILKPLKYKADATIIATIGILYITQQTALIYFGADAKAVEPPLYFPIQFPWFGYSGYKLMVILAAIIILLITWYIIAKTKIGLIMRATQLDGEMAQVFGININKVYAAVFAVGAAYAAIAAILILPIRQAHYLMGQDPLFLSFIVVIIGGLGSIRGTIIAAIIIGMSDGIMSVFFSPTMAKMLSTIFVAMILIVKPGGLFGNSSK